MQIRIQNWQKYRIWSIQLFFTYKYTFQSDHFPNSMEPLQQITQINQSLLQIQKSLFDKSPSLDFKLYERNFMNRINFRSYLGRNYICSSWDKFKNIRIPITSLLLKILQTKSQSNIQRLNKITRLIYGSKLQNISKTYGLTSEQFFYNFALIINGFKLGSQKIESQLIKTINSEPFFDKIIMESFYQNFSEQNPKVSLNSSCLTLNISNWVKKQLGISILFSRGKFMEGMQEESVVCLKKNQKNQILYQVKSFHVGSMTSILGESKQQFTTTRKKVVQKGVSVDNDSKFVHNLPDIMLRSISSAQSPTRRPSDKTRINELYVSISLQNSMDLQSRKENMCLQKEQEEAPMQFKSRYPPAQKRFWRIFCCGAD